MVQFSHRTNAYLSQVLINRTRDWRHRQGNCSGRRSNTGHVSSCTPLPVYSECCPAVVSPLTTNDMVHQKCKECTVVGYTPCYPSSNFQCLKSSRDLNVPSISVNFRSRHYHNYTVWSTGMFPRIRSLVNGTLPSVLVKARVSSVEWRHRRWYLLATVRDVLHVDITLVSRRHF